MNRGDGWSALRILNIALAMAIFFVGSQTAFAATNTLRPDASAAHDHAAALNEQERQRGRSTARAAAAGPGRNAVAGARVKPARVRALLPTPRPATPHPAVVIPQNSAAKAAPLGGSRAPVYARLGGPASGKAAHAAALDGAQLRRKH